MGSMTPNPVAAKRQRRRAKPGRRSSLRHHLRSAPTCHPKTWNQNFSGRQKRAQQDDCRNQQYSIVALTDSAAGIAERYAYSAYGEPVFATSAGVVLTDSAKDSRYTYTGRERDEGVGLYHFRARMYDAESGRFCGRDPIEYFGRSNNFYAFVSSDPLASVDPSGMIACKCNITATVRIFYKKNGAWVPDTPSKIGPETGGFEKPTNFFGVEEKAPCRLKATNSFEVQVGYDLMPGGIALGFISKLIQIDIEAACYKKPCPCDELYIIGSMTSLSFWFRDFPNNWRQGIGTTIYGTLQNTPVTAIFASYGEGPQQDPATADCSETINIPISDGVPFTYNVDGNLTLDIRIH